MSWGRVREKAAVEEACEDAARRRRRAAAGDKLAEDEELDARLADVGGVAAGELDGREVVGYVGELFTRARQKAGLGQSTARKSLCIFEVQYMAIPSPTSDVAPPPHQQSHHLGQAVMRSEVKRGKIGPRAACQA